MGNVIFLNGSLLYFEQNSNVLMIILPWYISNDISAVSISFLNKVDISLLIKVDTLASFSKISILESLAICMHNNNQYEQCYILAFTFNYDMLSLLTICIFLSPTLMTGVHAVLKVCVSLYFN